MRALLIDPYERIIAPIDYSGDYKQIYSLIDASTFDVVTFQRSNANHTETVFVDDEGLFKQDKAFFGIQGYPSPLCSYGLILGCDSKGDSVATKLTLEQANSIVTFLSNKI